MELGSEHPLHMNLWKLDVPVPARLGQVNELAADREPAVVCFDETDSLLTQRRADEHQNRVSMSAGWDWYELTPAIVTYWSDKWTPGAGRSSTRDFTFPLLRPRDLASCVAGKRRIID
jgi:hypothetical protein